MVIYEDDLKQDRQLTVKAQGIIWGAYDNLQILCENFSAKNYAEAVQELERLEEEVKTIRNALNDCPLGAK